MFMISLKAEWHMHEISVLIDLLLAYTSDGYRRKLRQKFRHLVGLLDTENGAHQRNLCIFDKLGDNCVQNVHLATYII